MKNRILSFIIVFCSIAWVSIVGTAAESSSPWMTDYAKALEIAKKENKSLLLDFTGSDWCGWCIKLDREVFEKSEFIAYAKEKLVLVKLDFPQKKAISEATKKQNQTLAKEFGIKGYPTIILLNSEGKKTGSTGYLPGGPAAFIGEVKKIIGDK